MMAKILYWLKHLTRWSWFGGSVLLALLIVGYGLARYALPMLIEDQALMASRLSEVAGQRVEFDTLRTHWDGIHPGVRATKVRVYATGVAAPTVALDEVRVSLEAWRLLTGDIRIHRMVAVRPQISIERRPDNKLQIRGMAPIPVAPAEATTDDRFTTWLFAQRQLSIEEGTLRWTDRSGPAVESLVLRDANLSLRNDGNRHRVIFNATFPTTLCHICALDLDIEGNPTQDPLAWGGRVNVLAAGLQLSGLPRVVRDRLPWALEGNVDVQLRTQWAAGLPTVAQGFIDARSLSVPWVSEPGRIRIDRLRGKLRWVRRGGVWQLDLNDTLVGLGRTPWSAGYVRIDHGSDITSVRVRHLDLAQAGEFVQGLGVVPELLAPVRTLGATGALKEVVMRLDRRADAGNRFALKARLADVAFKPYERVPGMRGVSGRLTLSEKAGEFRLDSRRFALDYPGVFRESLPARRVSGRFRWERKQDYWELSGQGLNIASDILGRGDLLFRLPQDRAVSPYLKLRFDITGGTAARASRFYPVNRMRPKLVAWLDESVLGGTVLGGHVVFEGETREFPFRQGDGQFEVQARLGNAGFRYLPGWEPVRRANTTLLFRGPAMLITAQDGSIRDLAVDDVTVRIDDLATREAPVHIGGRVRGPVASALDVLRAAPLQDRDWATLLTPSVRGEGNGTLNLAVTIPRTGPAPRIDGEYRFHDAALTLPLAGFALRNINGAIGIEDGRIASGQLDTRLLGSAARISVGTADHFGTREVVFRADGRVSAAGLGEIYGARVSEFVSGETPWSGELRVRDGHPWIALRSRLSGLRLGVPGLESKLETAEVRTVLESTRSDEAAHRLRFRLGESINGVLQLTRQSGVWQFDRGNVHLGFGEAAEPESAGLQLSLAAQTLEVDRWLDRFGGEGGAGVPSAIRRLTIDSGSARIRGYDLGATRLDLLRREQSWSGTVSGDTATGKVDFRPQQPAPQIQLELDQLRLPRKTAETVVEDKAPVDPRDLPFVAVKARQLVADGASYGAFEFNAAPNPLGWQVRYLTLSRPEMNLFTEGTWYVVAGSESVDLKLTLNSKDLGTTLEALGVKDQVRGGRLDTRLDLEWREDDYRPGLRNLNGTIAISMKDGSLLGVNEGAARIAGILNFGNIGQYLSLKFSPALGDGFRFQDIDGRIAIRGGTAYTDGIGVKASAANIVLRGHADFVDKKLDVRAEIVPNLRDPVTLATGWLWGPATAAWVLAFQEVFKKNIQEGTRIAYHVTGTFDAPVVEKTVGRGAADSGDG
jgi:uncharacterized protein (TIGR02099 family)